MGIQRTEICGEELLLLPEKAVFWPQKKALLLADLHLGKTEHFRRNGLGIPSLELRENLRLEALLVRWEPKDVYLLGDLFHSDFNQAWSGFEGLLSRWPRCVFTLVRGNHDRLDESCYAHPNLRVVPELLLEPFVLVHDHLDAPKGAYFLAGHIHPRVLLRGKGRQAASLPAFCFGPEGGWLPSFGTFTGGVRLPVKKNWKVFPVMGSEVLGPPPA